MTLESDQFGIPGKLSNILNSNTDKKSNCYLEILISSDYEVDDKLSNKLLEKDTDAREELLSIAKKQVVLFENLLDSISGIVGLKFHRQFVLKPLIENPLIISGPEPVSCFTGPSVEVLQSISFTDIGSTLLNDYIKSLSETNDITLAKAGSVFHWLLKAWRERDPIAKFIYLFIPLECVLQSDTEIPNEAHQNILLLETLVQNSESPDKAKLLSFLDNAKTKYGPNLNARFEAFAKSSGIPGWETDIIAFRKYNRMRNLLVHAGRKDIRTHINIADETRVLEDLVERYICSAFFGDHNIYASQWRPERE